ncbi:MAG: hypothetical protein LBM63_00930 [Rikenellaceae bacterium]|jgi:hypothetical protein|nr:hypothetical protein [Rikenellaceae bacterium]
MDLRKMKTTLARLTKLVGGWEKTGIDVLERDVALHLLREVYTQIRFEAATQLVAQPQAPKPQLQLQLEPLPELELEPEPEIEVVSLLEPEPAPAPKPTPEPAKPITSRQTVDAAIIRSLYGSNAQAPQPQQPQQPQHKPQQPQPQPQQSQPKPQPSQLQYKPKHETASLLATIGLNDKLLMTRDMFGGNEQAFEQAIGRLDEFADLDEAIIYIHDTYDWSAQSEGVKLLVELLERKLS